MNGLLIDLLGAILLLSGAGSAEELRENEMERFEYYSRNPMPVNQVSRSRMLSSGLFSAYQVAAVCEYRSRSGDILGPTELSLVDGIGPETADALAWFLSFESRLAPGERENGRIRQSLMLRGSARERVSAKAKKGKADTEKGVAEGGKYHIQMGERAELFWSTRTIYSDTDFSVGTLSLALNSRRGTRLILGDFAARFGQGLALWSSYSMSGFPSVSAFSRNASGFAPTGSFSPALRGVAADLPLGRWNVGGALAYDSAVPVPVVHASYSGRRGQFGVQALRKEGTVVSADGTIGLGHWTVFGESALSSRLVKENGFLIRRTRLAGMAGVSWAPAYRLKFSALARYYPSDFYSPYAGAPRSASKVSDEEGLSFGAQWRKAEITLDAARHPAKGTRHFKGILSVAPEFSTGGLNVCPSLRLTERFRPEDKIPWRHELRSDVKLSCGAFSASCRAHLVKCRNTGVLVYAEPGMAIPASGESKLRFSAFLRGTLFRAESWDDRIYCYERDLPGAFTVPAYYGRGWSISVLAGLNYARQRLTLRASVLRQAVDSRPDTSEIKLQYQIDF